jgi:hypothetical protein
VDGGLLRSDQPHSQHLGHARVIRSELGALPLSDQICSTIANVSHMRLVPGENECGERRPHSLVLVIEGGRKHGRVCRACRASESLVCRPRSSGRPGAEHGLDGQATGHLACRVPTHAIRDDEQDALFLWWRGDIRTDEVLIIGTNRSWVRPKRPGKLRKLTLC